MTFYSDLAGTDAHADLVLALRIEGIPVAFVERTVPTAVAAALSGYTQFVGITRVEEGEAALDMDERRELAATLEIDLLDDDAKTLSSLFAINKRRATWLTADATAAATSLTVYSTLGFSNGQTIYTDGETIKVGTVGASFTGCTRGAFGSTARPLYGATTGYEDPVYTTPPSWRGRRAYLYGYTLDANGNYVIGKGDTIRKVAAKFGTSSSRYWPTRPGPRVSAILDPASRTFRRSSGSRRMSIRPVNGSSFGMLTGSKCWRPGSCPGPGRICRQ